MSEIRSMREEDLAEVAAIADAAFIAIIGGLYGKSPAAPFFPPAGLGLRLAADPEGCLVASDGGRVEGALFSVTRGSMAFFGPVAVAVEAQGRGIGRDLVAECVNRWRGRGVQLMGLETFPTSSFHLHLYASLGFRPGWTGVQLERALEPSSAVTADGGPPLQHPELALADLGFIYPGLDPTPEARATLDRRAGRVFATDRGLAILHLEGAFRTGPESAFIPFLAAADRAAFDGLLDAAEDAARAAGKRRIATRIPGSCWSAYRALTERGYRASTAMLRMKAGENLDYERDAWYCDDWL